jgi:hypothetical protein
MNRKRFLTTLGGLIAAPLALRALANPISDTSVQPVSSTIWLAQTEDGRLYGGRMAWSEMHGRYILDKPPAGRIIGTAFYEPPVATPANGWGQIAPRPPMRCYGSLALRRP